MRTLAAFCCFLYASWSAEANIQVEGTEGGGVTFECKHKLASGHDKYFCRHPCEDNRDILATVKYGTATQTGRITLADRGNGAFTVSISQLQLSDSGTYFCAVDRFFFDTFTAVHLVVDKAVSTVASDVPPTWTQAKLLFSTQQKPEMDASGPTVTSATSSYTDRGEEEDLNTNTVLYATIGAVSTLAVVVFAASFRKCRQVSDPQPRVHSSAEEREEFDSDYENIDKHVQSVKKPPEWTPCAQQPNLEPPTSTSASTAADSVSSHVYENVSLLTSNANSRKSAANDHDPTSRTYIQLLAPTASEQGQDGPARKHYREL